MEGEDLLPTLHVGARGTETRQGGADHGLAAPAGRTHQPGQLGLTRLAGQRGVELRRSPTPAARADPAGQDRRQLPVYGNGRPQEPAVPAVTGIDVERPQRAADPAERGNVDTAEGSDVRRCARRIEASRAPVHTDGHGVAAREPNRRRAGRRPDLDLGAAGHDPDRARRLRRRGDQQLPGAELGCRAHDDPGLAPVPAADRLEAHPVGQLEVGRPRQQGQIVATVEEHVPAHHQRPTRRPGHPGAALHPHLRLTLAGSIGLSGCHHRGRRQQGDHQDRGRHDAGRLHRVRLVRRRDRSPMPGSG